MVTYNSAGRLGNVFFEVCTMLAYALKNGIEFHVPNKTHDPFWQPIYFTHLSNSNWNPNKETIRLWENGHEYQELPFEESWRDKNIIIEGYRQSAKYFDEYRSEILYLLDLKWEQRDYVSLHIRRGDYVYLVDKHPPFSLEYFKMVTSKFYNMGYDKFRVFSDDIPFCREVFKDPHFSEFKMEYSANSNELDDLIDGSCGVHQAGMSSTFFWAMAWLNQNKNKIVYFPKLWFCEGYHLKTDDIVPEYFNKV